MTESYPWGILLYSACMPDLIYTPCSMYKVCLPTYVSPLRPCPRSIRRQYFPWLDVETNVQQRAGCPSTWQQSFAPFFLFRPMLLQDRSTELAFVYRKCSTHRDVCNLSMNVSPNASRKRVCDDNSSTTCPNRALQVRRRSCKLPSSGLLAIVFASCCRTIDYVELQHLISLACYCPE